MVTEGERPEEQRYKSTLDADTLETARLELREDDSTREQTLEQFRHWIGKHPAIKRCRTDAPFLLRFLRTKKFNLPMAQEMLERYLTIRQLYPQWFQKLDIDDPIMEAIIDGGYLVPLLKRDPNGRKVILLCAGNFREGAESLRYLSLICYLKVVDDIAAIRCPESTSRFFRTQGRFDPYKFSSLHLARVHSLVVESLLDDEQSQICGYTHINDDSGLTMGHFSAWSFIDIRNLIKGVQNSTPMRHKEIHFINFPSAVVKIMEFGISLLNDKLKGRIMVSVRGSRGCVYAPRKNEQPIGTIGSALRGRSFSHFNDYHERVTCRRSNESNVEANVRAYINNKLNHR